MIDHFGQTFGDINVGNSTPNQNFWFKLAKNFYGVAGVFSTSSVQKPSIAVKVLQKCLRRRNRQQRGIFSSWVGVNLGVLTCFL
jgi:hypothetical protein